MKMSKKQKTRLLKLLMDYGQATWDSSKKKWVQYINGMDYSNLDYYVEYYVSARGYTIFDVSDDDYKTIERIHTVKGLFHFFKELGNPCGTKDKGKD